MHNISFINFEDCYTILNTYPSLFQIVTNNIGLLYSMEFGLLYY